MISLFWTIIAFSPICVFWWTEGLNSMFWILLGISIFPVFIKYSIYESFQLSQNKKVYQQIGIPFFQQFTQRGKLSKKTTTLFKKKSKTFSKEDLARFKQEIIGYEIYHYCCLLFFIETSIYALSKSQYLFCVSIVITNIFYNVIPILIQQFNKVRIERINLLGK